jgi:hypothetical protein
MMSSYKLYTNGQQMKVYMLTIYIIHVVLVLHMTKYTLCQILMILFKKMYN